MTPTPDTDELMDDLTKLAIYADHAGLGRADRDVIAAIYSRMSEALRQPAPRADDALRDSVLEPLGTSWPEVMILADFKPGTAYFPAMDCLEYYEADETAITIDLPSGGASVQWNADRTKIIGVTIYGVRAALASVEPTDAAKGD